MGHDAVQRHVAGFQAPGDAVGPGHVSRVHIAVEPVRRVVGDGHGLVVAVVGQHHHHRPEGLLPHGVHVRRAVGQQGRSHEVAGQVRTLASAHQRGAISHPAADEFLHAVPLAFRDQRTDEGVAQGGIPHLQHPGHRLQRGHQLVVEAGVADHPGGCRADLSTVEAPHAGYRPDGGIHVRVLGHDQRTLAAQLHQHPGHRCGTVGHDPLSDGRRPGEADHVHVR